MELTNLNKDRKFRRTSPVDVSTIMYGKVPPQARELEEAVLGAIMLEKAAFDTVIEILKPECFYVESHQRIYRAMQALAQKSQPIDMLTVVEELKFREELEISGGAYYITRLTNSVVSAANIDAHSRIILQKFIQRELIRISGEIIGDAYEDSTDVFDLLDDAEGKLFEITNNHLRKNFDSIDTVLVKTIQRIEDLRNKNEDISGVPSGFASLDRITYGWQPTDLIVLAARPSVGKTAFALNLARNAALHPTKSTPVAVFSLEMSAGQLVQRILSAESEIWLEKISRGKLEEHEMKQLYARGIQRLAQAPIFIDDSAALNIFELRAKCRRLKNKHNVGLIIIDYLQLMSGTGDNRNGNREQEISRISRDLKALAKELQVPIIALSQLSREVEKRKEGNKMPQLSDLRESGAIEQDADMVMFLYRPEYYDITANEFGESNKGETHVRIAKHRNGSLETIKLKALLHIQKFMDDDGSGGFDGFPQGGNWKPVQDDQGGAKLYIQAGSKMNDIPFNDAEEKSVLTGVPALTVFNFMAFAYFYFATLSGVAEEFSLNEPSSRHIVQVPRMREGEELILTDGRGLQAVATILEANKKHCRVRISGRKFKDPDPRRVTIALSLLKNTNRFEWFLEKATELGISEIVPLKCSRTEKQQFRKERMQSIVESALVQSQQSWMPLLQDPVDFPEFIDKSVSDQKFIAHCGKDEKRQLSEMINTSLSSQLILIGPEGDFTEEETGLAFQNRYIAVSLGEQRLRSETAAVAAAAILKLL